ncbi:hypothetical protein [Romboutsia sp. 1001285H_161024_C4]|uniref:hypothetical protein n=1 Tax=Romboutsia sp. 1001285H_161024_C4 TaxID=2787109 RepID=UPI00189762AF|nr:hypothetical protein [Romboutsia sp. 1001285H_161024_C4]
MKVDVYEGNRRWINADGVQVQCEKIYSWFCPNCNHYNAHDYKFKDVDIECEICNEMFIANYK